MNNKWMDDPVLSNVSDEKFEILNKIIEGSKGMEPKSILTYLIKESNEASKKGINFTNEETDAILNVLKEDMPAKEIKKIDMIRNMVGKLSKK